MRTCCCLSFVFLLLSPLAIAQTGDYVVTVRNDTLYGTLRGSSFRESYEGLVLKDKDKKRTNFTANTARAFRLGNDTYHSVRLVNRYVFMKVLVSGYASAYEHEVMGGTSVARETNDYVKINMGDLVVVPKIGFRKKMESVFQECPAVVAKIADKSYDFADLAAIVQHFNRCVGERPAVAPPSAAATGPNANLQTLLSYLTQHPQTASHDDLVSVIRDIDAKVAAGVAVPRYLLETLVNLSKPTSALADQALQAAQTLGYPKP